MKKENIGFLKGQDSKVEKPITSQSYLAEIVSKQKMDTLDKQNQKKGELKNEVAIKELKLFKGRKIRLIDVDKISDDQSKKIVGLVGVLGENIVMDEPIILTGGGHENRTREVRNISFKNGECRVQTYGDVIYKLEIL